MVAGMAGRRGGAVMMVMALVMVLWGARAYAQSSQYFLDITVYNGTTAVTTVKAGQSYRIHVETRCGTGISNCPKTLEEVEYSLLSGPTAFIRNSSTGDALSGEKNVTFPKDYNGYYFSVAGPETIFSSGVATVSGQQVVSTGTRDITVRPGDPAKAVFTDPIPISQLGTAPAPVINRGADRPVTVEVQDRFGNAVDQAVQVTIASSDVAIGDVGAPGNINAKTVATTTSGVATFNAVVTNGATGQTFDMTATIPNVTQTDNYNKGRLSLDRPVVPPDDSGAQWVVTVKNNPFTIGGPRNLEVVLSISSASAANISASIAVFDKSGALVVDTLVKGAGNSLTWSWNGASRRGRFVNTGTYVFKAVCEAETMGEGGTANDKSKYSVTKYIGVVRGKNSFTSGNSPISKLSGASAVGFFWDGGVIKSGTLSVYDASGNVVKRINVKDSSAGGGSSGKRKVGEWDLTDAKGRAVAEGSYLVAGTLTFSGGEGERVSVVVGVGR